MNQREDESQPLTGKQTRQFIVFNILLGSTFKLAVQKHPKIGVDKL